MQIEEEDLIERKNKCESEKKEEFKSPTQTKLNVDQTIHTVYVWP